MARILDGGVDGVFLDVQMPGGSGFDVLREVGTERMPPVIFVTAYDEFAVNAFDVNAVDYLLKPFDRERFELSLARLRERAAAGVAPPDLRRALDVLTNALGNGRPRLDRFAVRKPDGIVFIEAGSVDWIEAQGNYAALHVGRDIHLLREPLSALENRLDPAAFIRVRRTALVQVARIVALRPWDRDERVIVLASGARIAVSRRFRDRVERRLAAK